MFTIHDTTRELLVFDAFASIRFVFTKALNDASIDRYSRKRTFQSCSVMRGLGALKRGLLPHALSRNALLLARARAKLDARPPGLLPELRRARAGERAGPLLR